MGQRAKRPQAKQPRPVGKPGKRRVALVDLDTGEVLEGTPMLVSRVAGLPDWMMGMQHRIMELAADREITGETWRVFAFLLGRMAYENWVRISLSEIGGALGLHRQSVHRAMNVLVKKDIVEKAGTTIGGAGVYRVNKEVAWKGKAKNWKAAKRGDAPPPELRVVAGRDVAEKED